MEKEKETQIKELIEKIKKEWKFNGKEETPGEMFFISVLEYIKDC